MFKNINISFGVHRVGMLSETGWSLQHGNTERGLDF